MRPTLTGSPRGFAAPAPAAVGTVTATTSVASVATRVRRARVFIVVPLDGCSRTPRDLVRRDPASSPPHQRKSGTSLYGGTVPVGAVRGRVIGVIHSHR